MIREIIHEWFGKYYGFAMKTETCNRRAFFVGQVLAFIVAVPLARELATALALEGITKWVIGALMAAAIGAAGAGLIYWLFRRGVCCRSGSCPSTNSSSSEAIAKEGSGQKTAK